MAAVRLVQVARTGEPARELGDRRVTAPEVAHRVAVHAVPLGPEDREVPHLVAAGADVPRLRDQLHLREDRVLMDHVEERREPVDVVELSREGGREVEAEAVDVALRHEVPQRVHDQPQHRGVDGVERVPGPREVHVVPRVVRHEPVVRGVVHALERERGPEVAPLGRVVVDHVEDHLDPRAVERLDHPLELAHLLAARPGCRVPGVRREEADRRVSPVVREPPRDEEVLVGDVVHRQQLDRGDAEPAEVVDRRLRGEARVGAPQVLSHAGHPLGEPLDVQLVDHRLGPGPVEPDVALPVEGVVDHDAPGDGRRGVLRVAHVLLAGRVREDPGPPEPDRALDRLRVRVDQELRRVEAVAGLRIPRAVDAVAVALSRADPREIDVPVVGRQLAHLDALLVVRLVEQAELDAPGVLAEQREVRPVAVPAGTERKRRPRPGRATHRGTVSTGPRRLPCEAGQPAASARRSPRKAQSTSTPARAAARANASATCSGSPEMRLRPASST